MWSLHGQRMGSVVQVVYCLSTVVEWIAHNPRPNSLIHHFHTSNTSKELYSGAMMRSISLFSPRNEGKGVLRSSPPSIRFKFSCDWRQDGTTVSEQLRNVVTIDSVLMVNYSCTFTKKRKHRALQALLFSFSIKLPSCAIDLVRP